MSLEHLMRTVARLGERLDQVPSFRWATVTSTSPVQIRFDGEDSVLASTPTNLAGSIAVGVRVWVMVAARRVIILAKSGGVRDAPVEGMIRIGGIDYPSSGIVDVPALSFTQAGGVFYANVTLTLPFMQPAGWGFQVHAWETSTWAVMGNAHPSSGNQASCRILSAYNTQTAVKKAVWRLVKTA